MNIYTIIYFFFAKSHKIRDTYLKVPLKRPKVRCLSLSWQLPTPSAWTNRKSSPLSIWSSFGWSGRAAWRGGGGWWAASFQPSTGDLGCRTSIAARGGSRVLWKKFAAEFGVHWTVKMSWAKLLRWECWSWSSGSDFC